MQFQADILGCPIVRPADIETTALGAAYLAGLRDRIFQKSRRGSEILARRTQSFEPQMSEDQRESLLAGWRDAVARCRLR